MKIKPFAGDGTISITRIKNNSGQDPSGGFCNTIFFSPAIRNQLKRPRLSPLGDWLACPELIDMLGPGASKTRGRNAGKGYVISNAKEIHKTSHGRIYSSSPPFDRLRAGRSTGSGQAVR